MKRTKAFSDPSPPPRADPLASTLLVVALFATFVAVSYPVATAVLVALAVTTVVVRRTFRLSGDGYLCIPWIDRCYRVLPS